MNKKAKIIFILFIILFTGFTENIYADSNKKSQTTLYKIVLVTKNNISAFNLMKNLISENNRLIIDTMPDTCYMNFAYGINFLATSFPYSYNTEMNMLLLREGTSTSDFTQNTTRYNFNKWINDFENTYALQQIPKFKLYYGVNLNTPLESLGIFDDFNSKTTNFTRLTTNNPLSQTYLYISKIKHKIYTITDKDGTEDAAFITEIIHRTYTPYYNEPIHLNLNRPFFIIKDNKTEVMSFMGEYD